jgi:phage terminase large subunit GpA
MTCSRKLVKYRIIALLSRRFAAGSLKAVAARAPRNFRRHTARVLFVDEADACEPDQEGNPIRLAERRTLSFPAASWLLAARRFPIATPIRRCRQQVRLAPPRLQPCLRTGSELSDGSRGVDRLRGWNFPTGSCTCLAPAAVSRFWSCIMRSPNRQRSCGISCAAGRRWSGDDEATRLLGHRLETTRPPRARSGPRLPSLMTITRCRRPPGYPSSSRARAGAR